MPRNSGLLTGAQTGGVTIAPGSNFGLSSFGGDTAMQARFAALQQILTFDSGVQLISSSGGVLRKALVTTGKIGWGVVLDHATVYDNRGPFGALYVAQAPQEFVVTNSSRVSPAMMTRSLLANRSITWSVFCA